MNKHLEKFWTEDGKGLGSNLQVDALNNWNRWRENEEWYKKSLLYCCLSNEAARRYYSVGTFFGAGTPRMNQPLPARPDFKFFDAEYNKWNIIHNSGALKKSIQCFADLLPIVTTLHKNNRRGPRLLVISVDVLRETVTFDSYVKSVLQKQNMESVKCTLRRNTMIIWVMTRSMCWMEC